MEVWTCCSLGFVLNQAFGPALCLDSLDAFRSQGGPSPVCCSPCLLRRTLKGGKTEVVTDELRIHIK